MALVGNSIVSEAKNPSQSEKWFSKLAGNFLTVFRSEQTRNLWSLFDPKAAVASFGEFTANKVADASKSSLTSKALGVTASTTLTFQLSTKVRGDLLSPYCSYACRPNSGLRNGGDEVVFARRAICAADVSLRRLPTDTPSVCAGTSPRLMCSLGVCRAGLLERPVAAEHV
jgi:hypothetical protein